MVSLKVSSLKYSLKKYDRPVDPPTPKRGGVLTPQTPSYRTYVDIKGKQDSSRIGTRVGRRIPHSCLRHRCLLGPSHRRP